MCVCVVLSQSHSLTDSRLWFGWVKTFPKVNTLVERQTREMQLPRWSVSCDMGLCQLSIFPWEINKQSCKKKKSITLIFHSACWVDEWDFVGFLLTRCLRCLSRGCLFRHQDEGTCNIPGNASPWALMKINVASACLVDGPCDCSALFHLLGDKKLT